MKDLFYFGLAWFRIPNNYEDIGGLVPFVPTGGKVRLTWYFFISPHRVDSSHRPLRCSIDRHPSPV